MRNTVTFDGVDFQVVNGFIDEPNFHNYSSDYSARDGGIATPSLVGVRRVTLVGMFQPTTPGEWPDCETETRYREWAGTIQRKSRKGVKKLYTIDNYYWECICKSIVPQNINRASVTWTAVFECPMGRMFSDAVETIASVDDGDTILIDSTYETPVEVHIMTAIGSPVTLSFDNGPNVLHINPTANSVIYLDLEKCTARRAGGNAMGEITGLFPVAEAGVPLEVTLTGASGIYFYYRKALI